MQKKKKSSNLRLLEVRLRDELFDLVQSDRHGMIAL